MFSRFDTIPACDGQTDGRTDGRTDGHPAYSYYVLQHVKPRIEAGCGVPYTRRVHGYRPVVYVSCRPTDRNRVPVTSRVPVRNPEGSRQHKQQAIMSFAAVHLES